MMAFTYGCHFFDNTSAQDIYDKTRDIYDYYDSSGLLISKYVKLLISAFQIHHLSAVIFFLICVVLSMSFRFSDMLA